MAETEDWRDHGVKGMRHQGGEEGSDSVGQDLAYGPNQACHSFCIVR